MQDKLSDAIDVVNSEHSDFDIPYVTDANFDIVDMPVITINQFPFICVYTDSDAPGEDLTNYEVNNDFNINIKVYVSPRILATNTGLAANKISNLQRAAYRYVDAIARVIKRNDTLDNYVELCRFDGFEYADLNDFDIKNISYWATSKWIVTQENFMNKEV